MSSRPSRPMLALAISVAEESAATLSHQLDEWEHDSPRSAVTFCSTCGLAATVYIGPIYDGEEPQGGSCLSDLCAGRRVRPAWSTAA